MTTARSKGLIEDVNNKPGQHVTKNEYWNAIGVKVVRNKLPYGDYMLPPPVVVDTKRDIMELAGNIKGDHRRFRDAAILAMECGSHMVILTENDEGVRSLDDLASWRETDRSYKARLKNNSNAKRYEGGPIAEACRTMSRRYGLEFDFCGPSEAGRRVLEILGVVVND